MKYGHVNCSSFDPWARPRRNTGAGPEQHVTVRRSDDYETITIREAGHDDWDAICDHWAAITEIANTEVNLPSMAATVGPARGGTSSMTDIEQGRNAYLRRVAAVGWIAELAKLQEQLARLAQRASVVDPPTKKATKDDAERCVKCAQEIDPNAVDSKIHRVNGHPLHAKTCYLQVWRQSVADKIDMVLIVNQMALNLAGTKR